jgi:TRAP transporter 4TM/12TM fusion protein
MAAFLPAILYYLSAFIVVDAEVAKLGLRGLSQEELPRFGKTILEGWQFLVPIAVLIIGLLNLHLAADKACLYALVALVFATMLNRETRLTFKKIGHALENGARGMLLIGIICASVGIIVGSLGVTGVALRLSGILVNLAGGNLFLLLVLGASTSIILGMGLPTVACYVLLAVLLAPSLVTVGVPPMAAHLFIFYFGMAHFLTPPVCTGVYVATGIAGGDMLRTAFEAMRLGIVIYIVPFLFVYRPSLLIGSASIVDTISNFFIVTAGILLLSSGLAGYFMFGKVYLVQRILLITSGLLIFIPDKISLIVGIVLGVCISVWLWFQVKSLRKTI